MKSKLNYAQLFFITLVATFISIFFATTLAKVFVGEVLVKTFGIDNYFTEFVLLSVPEDFFRSKNISDSQLVIEESTQDKWQEMYPFKETSSIISNPNIMSAESVDKNKGTETERIDLYATKYLWGYDGFVVMCNKFENFIRWNLESHDEYNGVVHLDDGYLVELREEGDMSEKASSIISLSKYCKKNGYKFLYIQEPYKINKYTDSDISGVIDFSNQNQDSLIKILADNSVTVLDFRELIQNEGLSRQQTFYRTDHHWLAETGFWASSQILNYLKDNYQYNVDTEIISDSNFNKKEFKNFFLGSQGKKVTLEQTTPDDFVLYYPKFDTRLNVYIPEQHIDKVGDFTLLYDMNCVSGVDYYNKNPYATYSYGDQPVMQITNELIEDDNTSILLIHDSFCDCVIPFLALGIKKVHALDLRHFTGSLETYIEKEKPDIVIVSSVVSGGEPIDWSTHKDIFDYR